MNARSPSSKLRQFHSGLVFTRTSVARQQEAKFLEMRAAMSVRASGANRQRDEAREHLAPVYVWFTEGFDTRDLKEAKALLGELSP